MIVWSQSVMEVSCAVRIVNGTDSRREKGGRVLLPSDVIGFSNSHCGDMRVTSAGMPTTILGFYSSSTTQYIGSSDSIFEVPTWANAVVDRDSREHVEQAASCHKPPWTKGLQPPQTSCNSTLLLGSSRMGRQAAFLQGLASRATLQFQMTSSGCALPVPFVTTST